MPLDFRRRTPFLFLLFYTALGMCTSHMPWPTPLAIPLLLLLPRARGVRWMPMCAACLGWALVLTKPHHTWLPESTQCSWTLRVETIGKRSEKHLQLEGTILSGIPGFAGRRMRVWVPNDCQSEPGDLLGLHGHVMPPSPVQEPGGFDQRSFYAAKQWVGLGFAQHVVPLGPTQSVENRAFFQRAQHRFTQRLLQHVEHRAARQLLPALVLGNKSELSRAMRNDFQAAGAMHILAVSGMHLGIVFLILRFAVKRLLPINWRWTRWLVIALGVWAFALLTGGAPSTVRAALLLSVVQWGTALGRRTATVNVLAGCAWVQCILEPGIWQDLGFQLSYAAVLGIVVLEPLLRHRIPLPRWLSPVGTLVRVSLAAQLATAPLVLLHFQQFPVYFLVCSVLVVPLTGCLLGGGLICVACSGTPPGQWMGYGLDRVCDIIAWLVHEVACWPGAVLTFPHWNMGHTVGLTGTIVLVGLALHTKQSLLWRLACMGMLGVAVWNLLAKPEPPACWVGWGTKQEWWIAHPASGTVLGTKNLSSATNYQLEKQWGTRPVSLIKPTGKEAWQLEGCIWNVWDVASQAAVDADFLVVANGKPEAEKLHRAEEVWVMPSASYEATSAWETWGLKNASTVRIARKSGVLSSSGPATPE